MSPNDWKIIEWDEKQTNKQSKIISYTYSSTDPAMALGILEIPPPLPLNLIFQKLVEKKSHK